MKRIRWFRAYCAVLVTAFAMLPITAAGQNKLPRVGVLTVNATSAQALSAEPAVFMRALAKSGWIEGKSFTLVVRHAQSSSAGFAQGAADLVNQQVDVIFANSAPALRAAFAATKTIPIVATDYTNDPVAAGYAKGYAHPGGNVTGVFLDAPQFAAKWLEMMREIVPDLTQVAAVWDPAPGDAHVRALTAAAASMGIKVQVAQVRNPVDIDRLDASLSSLSQALIVLPSPMHYLESERLATLAARSRLPASSMHLPFADAGGLLAYGSDDDWADERVATMIAKVLRGAKPGDLPIERPVKFDLIVNLKTAKALGIKIPESLLIRAERVIR